MVLCCAGDVIMRAMMLQIVMCHGISCYIQTTWQLWRSIYNLLLLLQVLQIFLWYTWNIKSFSSTVWNVSASVKMVKWHPWSRSWNNWYLVIIICYYIVNCVTVAYNWPSLFHCNYGRVGCFCECWLWKHKYLSIFTLVHMSHFRFCLLCHNFAEKILWQQNMLPNF